MFVYLITNTINQKKYVGKSNDPKSRWKSHLCETRTGSEYPVHRALRKYGPGNFRFDVLQQYETEDDSYCGEIFWIARLNSIIDKWGYNLTHGGRGTRITEAYKPTIFTPSRLSAQGQRFKNLWKTDEFRQAHLTACQDPEYRLKRSEISNQIWANPEFKQAFTVRMNAPETRLLLSTKAKERWLDDEFVAKSKAISASPEYRATLSKAVTEVWKSEEFRDTRRKAMARSEVKQRMVEGNYRRNYTPENIAKFAKIMDMRNSGSLVPDIAEAVGMSASGVYKVIDRETKKIQEATLPKEKENTDGSP